MNHSHDLTVALDRIIIWSDTWQLPIASKKCFAHRIALSPLHSISFNYKLGDCILDWSSNPKDLGVIMDSRQNYKKHIARVIHVANSRAYLILKCFKTRNPIILVRAFTTYIRPIIEYCSPVWSPHQTMLIKSIENIQKRFTKKISNNSCLSYSSRLQLLGLDSLELRRLKHDLVICFKIMHNLVCIDKNLFFEINNNNYTRGHTFRIRKQRCQLDIRKYCFSQRVVNVWNNLTSEAVNADNICIFKNKIKSCNFDEHCVYKVNEWNLECFYYKLYLFLCTLFSYLRAYCQCLFIGPVCPLEHVFFFFFLTCSNKSLFIYYLFILKFSSQ